MTEKNTNVEEKSVHDGIAPIHVPEGDEDKAFQSLWEYLVPSSGKAQLPKTIFTCVTTLYRK